MSNVRTLRTKQIVFSTLIAGVLMMAGRDAASQSAVKPRILILFDTSGSMTFDIDENDSEDGGSPTWGDGSIDKYGNRYCCPGLGESRMRIAKDAITQMIDSTGDIEFALMKFPQMYEASGNSGFSVQWYRNNQALDTRDVLRYEGLGAGDTDWVDTAHTWYDYSQYFLDGEYQQYDTEPPLAVDQFLCEEFPPDTDTDTDVYSKQVKELKAWFDHHEYVTNVVSVGDTDTGYEMVPDTSGYLSPAGAGDYSEQELRADGGTPLGEAVHAAYIYLNQVKKADPVGNCRPYYLIVLADGDFDGVINPITGVDEGTRVPSLAYGENAFGVQALYANLHVETWVIGLAAASETLDHMADVGGCHWDMDTDRDPRLPGTLHDGAYQVSECDTANPGHAFFANSKESLSTILAEIISSAILYEECNYLDDDCDGEVDEGVAGAYCDRHHWSLPDDVQWDSDSGMEYPYWTDTDGIDRRNPNWEAVCEMPPELYCDGIDDNCNGQVDEMSDTAGWDTAYNPGLYADCIPDTDSGFSTSIPASYDDSASQCVHGRVECIPGSGLECIGAIGPSEERCDRIDNDCDGFVDEQDTGTDPLEKGDTCGKDVGECKPGKIVCDNGGWKCNAIWGTDELCDGRDNDCDGQTDETFPNKGRTCYSDFDSDNSNGCLDTDGSFECHGICETGRLTCSDATEICVGMVTPRSADNTCNGLDDDCDGLTDEGVDNSKTCPDGSSTWTTRQMYTYSLCNAGTMQCQSDAVPPHMECIGNVFTGAIPGPTEDVIEPKTEVCDGWDNDCDREVDEGLSESCGGCEVGVDVGFDCIPGNPGAGRCVVGTRTCLAALGSGDTDAWSECVGDVGPIPEECNNIDDDCDGEVDEATDLKLGACYPQGLSGCSDGKCVGICSLGTYECTEQGTLACEDYVKPVSEGDKCNNLDDNCNGEVDEGITSECGPAIDTTRWPDAAYGKGICRLGIRHCSEATENEAADTWGECTGAQGPVAELCNGLDDDCDGKYEGDEAEDLLANSADSLVGTSCGSCDGIYECRRNEDRALGQMGAYALVCVSTEPRPEVCNGLDENCNGIADDGIDPVPCGGCTEPFDDESPCVPGDPAAGECETGLNYCLDKKMTTECYGSVGPVAEVCDGKDNDCDGLIDEDFNDMEDMICQVAVGECPEGIQQCVSEVDSELVETALHCCDADIWRATGDCISPEVSQIEVCDGRDNDCDGSADEDLAGAGEVCGQSLGICEPGLMQCVLNAETQVWGLVCIGGTSGTTESCNCIDDDCDGEIDEDIPPGEVCSKAPNWMSDPLMQTEYPEGIGECVLGRYECRDCGWECNAPGPTGEVCDGRDNDCDGLVDEDEEVECPLEGSVCVEGKCAEPCEQGEFVCSPGESCILFNGYRVCMATVCEKSNAEALPCVFNEYYCTPDQGFEPPCSCDPETQMCVDVCYGKVCAEGQVCVVGDNGRCHAESEGCMVTGCGAGQKCQAVAMCDPNTQTSCYECVTDLCDGITCGEDEYCDATGACVATCANVTCPSGQGCFGGVCVNEPCAGVICKSGVLCNPETGLCDQGLTNPCTGILCEFHERCEDGACVPNECMTLECPNGTVCYKGSCYDPSAQHNEPQTQDSGDTAIDSDATGDTEAADTATSPSDNDADTAATGNTKKDYKGLDNILATGTGGCTCATAPGAETHTGINWWLVAIAAVLAVFRLMRFKLSLVRATAVIKGSLLIGVLIVLAGCEVDPFSLANQDDTAKSQHGGNHGTGGAGSGDDTLPDPAESTDSNAGVDDSDGTDSSSVVSSDTDSNGTDAGDTGVDCATCDSDETCCKNDAGYQYCVNVQTNPRNCGACGVSCTAANATAGCEAGKCVVAACQTYYYDQNGDLSDGCEHFCQPTVDPEDNGDKCDGLATSADPAAGGYVALDNDCDFAFDEDVDFQNDDRNCGYCGHLCLFNHGASSCAEGQCVLTECDARWWNLNGSDTDGCEYYCDGDAGVAETCDNLDNNCNGEKDEGNPGGGAACYPETSAGCTKNDDGEYICSGVCAAGIISCVGGNLECVGYQLPETEVCDGLDNNCNGQVDEALRIACGGAPGDNPNLGVCQTGLANCTAVAADDGGPGAAVYDTDSGCVGDVSPAAERCDGLDNDCDGKTDEMAAQDGNANNIEINDGLRIGAACGLGACAKYVTQCVNGTITCEDFTAPDAEIACNNIDDDCDGSVDEVESYQCGGSSGVPCNATDSECDAYSEGICQVGRYSCDDTDGCVGDVGPTCADTEHCDVCDGEDNDCDGLTDEDAFYGYGEAEMRCGSPCNDGTLVCVKGALSCEGANGNYGRDVCDGVDNDCDPSSADGSADTEYQLACDGTDDADLCADGVLQCNGTDFVCIEPAAAAAARVEVCDGKDNDCDSEVDEDLSPPASVEQFGCLDCPVGITQVVCAGTAGWKCQYDANNQFRDVLSCADTDTDNPCYDILDEEFECDSVDNDCDGVVDDDYNFSNDENHCGGCYRACADLLGSDTSATALECNGGVCEVGDCYGNYRDANLEFDDGCECEFNVDACGTDPDNPYEDCDVCWGSATYGDDNCDNVKNDGAATIEQLCDGIDNDCDTAIDLDDGDLTLDDAPADLCSSRCVESGDAIVACDGDAADSDSDDWTCTYNARVQLDTDGVPVLNETLCDAEDNDCDGFPDESLTMPNTQYLGAVCDNANDSDPYSQGACIISGRWRCDVDPTAAAVCCEDTDIDGVCNHVLPTPTELKGDKKEELNGLDDNCDGDVDEMTDCMDSDAVVEVDYNGDNVVDYEIFAYEASRYGATSVNGGTGNNGVACSRPGVIPWTGLTYTEAVAACDSLDDGDGRDDWIVCSASQWQLACQLGLSVQSLYPYNEPYNASYCNGIDKGTEALIPGGSLEYCLADWGQTTIPQDLWDMSGNAEEWTSTETSPDSGKYQIRGGSYNDQAAGLTCTFDLWAANGETFRMDNLGFRCCRGNLPDESCGGGCDGRTDQQCENPGVSNVLRKYDGGSNCYANQCYDSYVEIFCANGCDNNALGAGLPGCIDMDGDGYVHEDFSGSIPAGLQTGDCDDLNADAHPNQCEIYSEDGVDNDCDGTVDEVELTATIRDFKKTGASGGHADFEMAGLSPFNVCTNLVNTTVDATTYKPVYNTTTNGICSTGSYRVITSATTFADWYNTDPSGTTNRETTVCMPLVYQGNDIYTAGADIDGNMFFDYGCTQLQYFPIDGELFADSETPVYENVDWESCDAGTGDPHNFFFTTEMHFMFRYETGQTFAFSGDDDLWVFINGTRVMDLGGVHGEANATVNLDTLGLTAGNSYRMDIFNAERHTTHSNFLITTSIAGIEAVPK